MSENIHLKTEQTIKELYAKYSNDLYMTSKMFQFLNHQLPTLLENIQEGREKSQQRISELTEEQDKFIHSFLAKNRYFYHASNEKYFYYDKNTHFIETCENDILYKIVTSISQERNQLLMIWKHKTKNTLLKRIKDMPITKTIPESQTIQEVLDYLVPHIFTTRTEAKYFLTILGDNILKKNSQLIHFISPSAKPFLREINNACILWFNYQCILTFKHKCHEKHYELDNKDCRLLNIRDITRDQKKDFLNLLCVACHYSSRYEDADHYLMNHSNDPNLQNSVMKMTFTTPDELVLQFVQEYIQVLPDGPSDVSSSPTDDFLLSMVKKDGISWKHMHYLWKEFIKVHQFPLNLYQPLCKKILSQTVFPEKYDSTQDFFNGLSSSQIPMVQKFLKFWKETIIEEHQTEGELEIEELAVLFRYWYQQKMKTKSIFFPSEAKIVDILNYYFPDLEIEDKYIYRIRCVLWDKDMDIETVLSSLRDLSDENKMMSLYDMYCYYCKDKKKTPLHLKASKNYFEKYIRKNYSENFNEDDLFLL
jgi:hypothetical protein